MSQYLVPSFRHFFIRSWLFNIVLTLTFGILLLVVWRHYVSTHATRTDCLINLSILAVCSTHTLLLAIFSVRRFSRKHTKQGVIFLAHFFASAILVY
ncbi:MAG TPA: hypothetical protein VK826_17580, partial [Bacteroidia bacterium]|nr:hypothetical protein [Bacteroidia bacterium]